MAAGAPFYYESRPHGDDGARRGHVGIKCGQSGCGREDWRVAKNAGWGGTIFGKDGWEIGRTLAAHRCPEHAAHRHSEQAPYNRHERRALKGRVAEGSVGVVDPVTGQEMSPAEAAAKLSQLGRVKASSRIIDGAVVVGIDIPQPKAPPAPKSEPPPKAFPVPELRYSRDGRAYYPTTPGRRGGGVIRPRGHSDSTGAKSSAQGYFRAFYGAEAVEGEHFWIIRASDKTYGWVLEKPPEPATDQPKGEPMSETAADTHPAERKATLAQNRAIREQLDTLYVEDKARYRGDWTDAKLAATLDMPAIFVRTMREASYGAHDRNETADLAMKRLAEIEPELRKLSAEATAKADELLKLSSRCDELAYEVTKLRGLV